MSDLNIGKVIIDQTKTSQVTVNYADTSKPDTSTITSNRTQMTATVDSISTAFEVSKTYYFDADGGLMTTDQGYGTLGTTDSDGVLTVAHLTPSLALTAPSAGTKYELEESFNVTWTSSNITLVNIILESESGGYKIFEDVDASLGTLAVSILASDGFKINETVYIYIENTHQTLEDSVDVVVASGVTILSKLQIGTYFDTISQTTINAPNTVWGCVYNDAEEAFFVGGTTNKSNFYNSGTTLIGTNVQPFIMRLSKLGEVVWCKQFNADDATKSMCLNPIFARNGKVVLTFRISSNNRRRTFSVNYDGTEPTLSTDNGIVGLGLAEVGYSTSDSIGVVIGIGTFSGASNRVYMSRINSGGWILSPVSSPINISNRTFGTSQLRGVISNNIIYYTGTQLTSDSPSKNAEVYTYNLGYGTTSIAFTQAFSENSPVPHAVLSNKAIYSENSDWVTNIDNNRVMVTATAKTTIPDSPRKFSVFMFEDSASLLFIGGIKGITGRNPVTYERLWLKDIDTIDNTAVITDCRLATTVDDEYILMSGQTTGNFDGNNTGNTTLNGILYVIKKTGEDL